MAARREIPPSPTIYVKNLNEKARKTELKRALYALFSQFGPILDVVALKTPKMRGQAFIVFRDLYAAANAMREMQNFHFFEKPMVIQYAKAKSDAISKLDGTFAERTKVDHAGKAKKRKAEEAPEDEPSAKRQETPAAATAPQRIQADLNIPPNRVLFLQNLPDEATDGTLVPLFQQFPGFIEVRMVPGKKVAFVEFQNEHQSGLAMSNLQGFKLSSDKSLVISFQKQI